MPEHAREGVETAKEARKGVLELFKKYHPDTGDTPFNQSASRMLSSVLSKINDNPKTSFGQLRWDRTEESMVRAGIPFVKQSGVTYTWSPATPAELVQALQGYTKGELPAERVTQGPAAGQSPLFEYDDTFAKTYNDREKTPPTPEELADVIFYANTLTEMYNIKFVVQPKMYEYDWFIKNARNALSQINTFLKEQTQVQRNAYAGVTINLIGFVSHFKMGNLTDEVYAALIEPGFDGAAWQNVLNFYINPAALRWGRDLGGPDAKGDFLGREFAKKAEVIGFESRLKGTPEDVKEIQQWLVDTYGFAGVDVPDEMAAQKDDPEVRMKAFTMFAFLARALKEAQYSLVDEGNPPNEKRIRKEIFTLSEMRTALEGGYIALGVGDDRDDVSAYARETKNGVCVYVHEKLDSLWIVDNLQGIAKKKKDAASAGVPRI